jgi:Spy/CpxP family protein refolding chaperone
MSEVAVRGARAVRTRSSRSWAGMALTVSLALNVFFLAVIGGTVVAIRAQHSDLSPFERVALRLQLNDQQLAALHQLVQTMHEQGQAMRTANQALMQQIGEVNVDKKEVESLLARTVRNRTNFQMGTASDLSLFILSLTPEQRAKFVEGLRQESQPTGLARIVRALSR